MKRSAQAIPLNLLRWLGRAAAVTLIVAVLLVPFEILHFMSGTNRTIHVSPSGAQIATVTHGFLDRHTYVFDQQLLPVRKAFFSFDPYAGPFTMSWDASGQIFRWERGGRVFTHALGRGVGTGAVSAGVSTATPFFSGDHEPMGEYLWLFQSLGYDTD